MMRLLPLLLELVGVVLVGVVLFTVDWRLTAIWVALVCGVVAWVLDGRKADAPSTHSGQ